MTTHDTGTSVRAGTADPVLPSATTLGKGLAVLRIFFGIVLFANGVAKLFEFRRIEVGPYIANLIDKGAARSILANGFDEGDQERSIPGLRPVMELMVDNWGFVGWALTFTELVVGAMLIVGAATRLAAPSSPCPPAAVGTTGAAARPAVIRRPSSSAASPTRRSRCSRSASRGWRTTCPSRSRSPSATSRPPTTPPS